MRVFWWQGGLHFTPETEKDQATLDSLKDSVVGFSMEAIGEGDGFNRHPHVSSTVLR
jgi:hypothetical protein